MVNDTKTRLEELADVVRSRMFEIISDVPTLRNRCGEACAGIILASKLPQNEDLASRGVFIPVKAEVAKIPWKLHNGEYVWKTDHWIALYTSPEGTFVLDPTIDQFPFLRGSGSTEGFVFEYENYPRDRVNPVDVNPAVTKAWIKSCERDYSEERLYSVTPENSGS